MEHKELYKIRDFIDGLNEAFLATHSEKEVRDMVIQMDFRPCEKELSSNILKPDDDSLDGYLILINKIRNQVEKKIDQSYFTELRPDDIAAYISPTKKKLETLIQVLNDALSLALEQPSTQPKAKFKLIDKKGAKVDLIRILNAIYELHLIQKQDGQFPNKGDFMKAVGGFFGIDLSNYDTDLSQALKNTSLEANLKVFEEMKTITQSMHYLGEKNK